MECMPKMRDEEYGIYMPKIMRYEEYGMCDQNEG